MHNMEQLEADFSLQITPGVLKDAMKAAGASSGDLWRVPIDKLRIIDGLNLRVHNARYQKKIEEYAESLVNEGWYANKPMTALVQKDEATGENVIYVVDGHTRLLHSIPLANKRRIELGRDPITEVTVIAIASKKSPKEPISLADLTVTMFQGNKSNQHTAYEDALACKRLAAEGEPVSVIAKRLGFSTEWVNSLLLLMSAPKELRERVANDELTVTLAVQLLKAHGNEAAEMVEDAAAAKQAEGDGKPIRITKKNIAPASPFTKAVKRSAGQLYEALASVKQDPAFAGLDTKTREKLLDILDTLEKTKDDGQVDHSKQTTIFDGEKASPEGGSSATA